MRISTIVIREIKPSKFVKIRVSEIYKAHLPNPIARF